MPKTEVAILGVCCECQSTHPVYTNTNIPDEEQDDVFGPFGCGEAGNYLMAKHRMFGGTGLCCEGEGTVPQAIVKD